MLWSFTHTHSSHMQLRWWGDWSLSNILDYYGRLGGIGKKIIPIIRNGSRSRKRLLLDRVPSHNESILISMQYWFKILVDVIWPSGPPIWGTNSTLAVCWLGNVQTKFLVRSVFQVTYGSLNVDDGNELTPTQVKDPPTLKWIADDDLYYLLCMTGTQVSPVSYPLSVICLIL